VVHFSRAMEKEWGHRGEANIFRSHCLMEKRQSREAIHILSCDHAGSGRGTDSNDQLHHNDSDQLQDIVVRLVGSVANSMRERID